MTPKLEIQWVHSVIACPPDQRATIKGLGFRRLYQTREIVDTAATRGMLHKVAHLVRIVPQGKKKS